MGPNSAGYPAKRSHKTRWIVIALVVILVLAINATWGWLYSNKRNNFHSQLNNAKQTASDQKNKTQQLASELADSKQRLAEKDKQKPDSQQTSSDFRQIPELGVQYSLNDSTKDLTYSYTGSDSIGFSTAALVDFGQQDFPNKGTCFASNAPIGGITMYKPGSTVQSNGSSSGTPIEQVDGAKKVGDNYFIFNSPQAACTKNHIDDEKSALQIAKGAFDSLAPIDQSNTSTSQ